MRHRVKARIEGVAARVRRASETVGFFYLAGHGVPAELIGAAFAGKPDS